MNSGRTAHLFVPHGRGTIRAHQFRPDLMPVRRAEIPPAPFSRALDRHGQEHQPLQRDVLGSPLVHRRRLQPEKASHLCGAAQGIDEFGSGWHSRMLGAPNIRCQGLPNAVGLRISEQ